MFPLNKLFLLNIAMGKRNTCQEQVTSALCIRHPEQQAETCETTATSLTYLGLAHCLETDTLCAAPDGGTWCMDSRGHKFIHHVPHPGAAHSVEVQVGQPSQASTTLLAVCGRT